MASPNDAVQFENVVTSTGIGQELDLQSLADDLPGASYEPDRFPGLIHRTLDPKATSLVFRSGKIVTTGTKTEAQVHEVLGQLYAQLAELGIEVPEEPDPTVQNMVGKANLGKRLNLNAIAIGLGLENVEYEPEQFPGLVYRLDESNVVVLLFGSGKLVITGAKQPEDASEALVEVRARLEALGLLA